MKQNDKYTITAEQFTAIMNYITTAISYTNQSLVMNVLSNAQSVLNEIHSGEKELLTDEKMREMLGDKYSHAIAYNFDTKSWSSSSMVAGIGAANLDHAKKCAYNFKKLLDSMLEYSAKYEIAGLAVMPIEYDIYPQYAKTVSGIRVPARKKGTGIAGTIISRDKAMGKIRPIDDQRDWIAADDFGYYRDAAKFGVDWFLKGAMDGALKEALIKSHIAKSR